MVYMNREMNKIRLLIADSDERFTRQAAHFLSSFEDIEVVSVEENGASALHHIRNIRPDAVLFDMVLPGLDGLNLLRAITEMDDAPATICCTRLYSEVTIDAARDLGVSYLLYKPVDLHALHPIIACCTHTHQELKRLAHHSAAEESDADVQSAEIRNYIVSLGVSPRMIGSSYLAEAVRLAKADPTLMHNMSKGLYLEIARNMDTSPSRIERSIRNAIATAHSRSELRSRMTNRPTNKEFINYILRNMPADD